MLTPVDLQQKKFTHGMGYARKDVDAFGAGTYEAYFSYGKTDSDEKISPMQILPIR